jgi:carboxypeptidase C (cathepsin A)/subtilisin family serine protease
MGPDLWELFEDGEADDEVAVIIRLSHSAVMPRGVRLVTQFGEIVTIRTTRANIINVSGAPEVVDVAAGNTYLGPDVEFDSANPSELSVDNILPADERRPANETATGRGVVIGVVDWGFDFAHPDFRNKDGSTRFLALWDQRGSKLPNSPQPFGYGVVHDREAINRALKEKDPYAALGYHPADADPGFGCHATHVLSIAAGGGGEDRPTGVAPEADIVCVHNAPWDELNTGRLGDSVTLLEAIDFISRVAGDRPWVVNLSMGRHGEQHDGSTLIEQGLDAAIRAGAGRAVCLSTGNYFDKRIHASGQLRPTQQRTIVWEVVENNPTNNQMEFWYSWQDRFLVTVRSPDGKISAQAAIGERSKFVLGGKEVGNVYHRGQEPNNFDNHITIYLYKEAPAGEWEVTITGEDVIDGRYHAWIERDVSCPRCQSRLRPDDADPRSTTGTICNGRRTLAVGAYNNHDPEMRIAHFSSVGPTRDGRLKPDLCAPGVAVLAARSAPREPKEEVPLLTRMSGTSMAAPCVAGTIALMFQAAPRRLRIEETHNLLLQSARKVSVPEEIPERLGIGFLDIEAAVEAARSIRPASSNFKQTTFGTPARAAKSEAVESYEGAASTRSAEAVPRATVTIAEFEDHEAASYREAFQDTARDNVAVSAGQTGSTQMAIETAEEFAMASVGAEESFPAVNEGGAMKNAFEAVFVPPLAPGEAPQQSTESGAAVAVGEPLRPAWVEIADQIVAEAQDAQPAVQLLHQLFDRMEGLKPLATTATGDLPTAAQIFNALVYAPKSAFATRLAGNCEVVALPNQQLQEPPRAGDILVRRGDHPSGHLSVVASPALMSLETLNAEGMTAESDAPGQYVHVVDSGAFPHESEDKYARQLTDGFGRVLNDVVLLRLATPPPSTVVINQTTATKDDDPLASSSGESADSDAEAATLGDNNDYFDMTELAPVSARKEIRIDNALLKYTATTGRMPIKNAAGQIEAEMFYVAYTLDGQDAAKRPLTFAFNGGPGSASLWLHMGAMGPRKVALQPEGFLPPAPYRIQNNPYALLDKSDLVFIDAIGTGFSRAASVATFEKFWGVRGDIQAFSEFIRMYITRNERWGSPLFLLGESYGTMRAAGIAGYLAEKGISFNGIALLSTVLNYQTLEATKTNDQPYIFLIPTFTMVAGYYHKLPPDLDKDVNRAREEAEKWASTEYAEALARGDSLSPAERKETIEQMSRFTGLSREIIDRANLRIDVMKFTRYLLLDRKLRVGRFDGRFSGADPGGLIDSHFYDPTEAATHPPFTSVFNNYLRTELGFRTDLPYYTRAQDADADSWNWGSSIDGFPDTATAMHQAMLKNPFLKVLVMEGYYDMATPFSAANYTIDHLDLPEQYRRNISVATYEAGHMVYLPESGLRKMKADVANFIAQSMATSTRPPAGGKPGEADFEESDDSTLAGATAEMSLKGIADGRLGQLPAEFLAAILTRGESGANQLANRVFWQKHPELAGKQLDEKDRSQNALRNEWARIFRCHVKPLIWLRAMINVLDKYRGTLPREVLLGWIAWESDGDLKSTTPLHELGYFQIMWQGGEAKDQLHMSLADFPKLGTDPEFSLEKGVTLVESYRQFVLKNYPSIADGSDLLWRLTKGRHAASGILKNSLRKLQAASTPITWAAVCNVLPSWMLDNIGHTMSYAAKLKPFAELVPAAASAAADTEMLELGEVAGPPGATVETFPNVECLDYEEWVKVKISLDDFDPGTKLWKEEEVKDSLAIHPQTQAELTKRKWFRKVGTKVDSPYELNWKARIYYPRGAKTKTLAGTRAFPVVILVHGAHDAVDRVTHVEIDSHLGYEFLQKELARNGIVSASVATNLANQLDANVRMRADFVLESLNVLKRLNSKLTRFHNRLDLQNVGFMGHSRGGDAVVKAIDQLRGSSDFKDFKVRAVCSLAPTDYTGLATNAARILAEDSLRYLVLYGSHDGDVGGQDPPPALGGTGFRHYDRATCERTLAFVKGMKHDRFNTVWTQQPDYADPFDCVTTDPVFLLPDDHKQLAIDYIGGLFRLELNGDTSVKGLFDGSAKPSGSHEVALQWSSPAKPRTITRILHGTPRDRSDKWTKGWTSLVPFRLTGVDAPFELAYKKSTGEASLDRIDPQTGADTIWSDKWRTGWSHFVVFRLPGDTRTHDLAYMESTGEVAIDRFAADGKSVETNIWKDKWSKGWTSFMPVVLPKDDRPYYLAYKKDSGEVTIDRIKPVGQGVESIFSAKWTKGWTAFMPFCLPGDSRQCYLSYKKDTGDVSIDRIEADGKNTSTLWSDTWKRGWTAIVPFRVPGDDRPHYLAYKDGTGEVAVDRIRRDGSATEPLLKDQWTAKWSHFYTFEANSKPHFLAYKTELGDIGIGRLLPDQMLEIETFEDRQPGNVPYKDDKDLLDAHSALTSMSRVDFVSGFFNTRELAVVNQTNVLKGSVSGAKYRADIPPENRVFLGFDLLTFRLTSDFNLTSEADIKAGKFPEFKVRVFHGPPAPSKPAVAEATHADIDPSGVRPRKPPFFREILDFNGACLNGTKIVFQTLAIPLSKFAGVDWANVRAIEFEAGPSVTSEIYFDSLGIMQS